jgi:hypothetical protein
MPIFAWTIFLSAFLLFMVQPIIAKQILPWFGGAPAVWNTCMIFFQTLLLAGYAYSEWSTRRLSPRQQALVHVLLLLISLTFLPIVASLSWKPLAAEDPVWRIFMLLTATMGLPYFLLASTGPLIQSCFVRCHGGDGVYRLFALSNVGSLLALLTFPLAIEPLLNTDHQALAWSVAYAIFTLLCGTSLVVAAVPQPVHTVSSESNAPRTRPTVATQSLWLMLSALGTVMLLSITNHITQNIASIPLLWLGPLTLYLCSFIVAFEGLYQRRQLLWPLLLLLPAMAWGLHAENGILTIDIAIPLYCLGLFVACTFFHGELAAHKPEPQQLARFYLMISLGGALGGMGVGLVAPRIFSAYDELPIALVVSGLVTMLVLYRSSAEPVKSDLPQATSALLHRSILVIAALYATLTTGWYVYQYKHDYLGRNTIRMERNFFGVLRVQEGKRGNQQVRNFVHGVIVHGLQSLDPAHRQTPTTYFTEYSGIGRALTGIAHQGPLRIGVIGLGAGTLAVYGRSGDVMRFYEINPQVVDVAQKNFSFLSDSQASTDIVLGDARLTLEREPPQRYDLLVVDAFSSDAIPIHLITLDAMDVFLKHLQPDGVLTFNVTNRYLDLKGVLAMLAQSRGLTALSVEDDGASSALAERTSWVLLSRNPETFKDLPLQGVAQTMPAPEGLKVWTDNFSNVFEILQ